MTFDEARLLLGPGLYPFWMAASYSFGALVLVHLVGYAYRFLSFLWKG